MKRKEYKVECAIHDKKDVDLDSYQNQLVNIVLRKTTRDKLKELKQYRRHSYDEIICGLIRMSEAEK